MTDPLLEISGLRIATRRAEDTVSLVEDVSLSVQPGERVGLVGESGSGKSLTCLSVMGLLPSGLGVVEGAVTYRGTDLTTLGERGYNEFRGSDLAMIYQEPLTSLNPLMRIGRQVGEVLGNGRSTAMAVREALHRVGIGDADRVMRQFPHELSGGMRQRAMIAMATLAKPRLLIADEPTTALDVTIQTQVLKVMYDISVEFGTAIVLVSHDLAAVERLVDRLVVMYAGRIVEDGPTAEVLARPQHPYTQALLASSPRVGSRATRLPVIGGSVPAPGDWPAGCHFAPRCRHRMDVCDERIPATEDTGPQHRVACFAVDAHDARRPA
jgi:peptide/nickel transport system ATP-binding protein